MIINVELCSQKRKIDKAKDLSRREERINSLARICYVKRYSGVREKKRNEEECARAREKERQRERSTMNKKRRVSAIR